MKAGAISIIGGVLGVGVVSALIWHSHATPTYTGYHGNGVSTYYSAGSGDSLQGSNAKQKIVSSNDKAYQDDSLDEQVQMQKDSGKPVDSKQPK